MSKAYFSCAGKSLELIVTGYNTSLGLQMSRAQLRDSRQNYPVRSRQSKLSLQVQMRGYEEQISLANFLRGTHLLAITGVDPLVRFTWESQSMDYLGYIPTIQSGLTTGRFFPVVTVVMELVSDLLLGRSYTSSWGTSWSYVPGDTINVDQYYNNGKRGRSEQDSVLGSNLPANPRESSSGPISGPGLIEGF